MKLLDLLVQVAILIVVGIILGVLSNALPIINPAPQVIVQPTPVIVVPNADLNHPQLQGIHEELMAQTKLLKSIRSKLFQTCW